MIWTVLLFCHAFFFLFLILSNRTRGRTKREPPLDKGVIPWLGHAISFGKDAAKFLTRMKEKHGDIFTVRVAGRYVTVLLDPNSYDTVLQNSDTLDFSRYAETLMQRIFNLHLPHHDPDVERAAMKQHFHGQSLTYLNTMMQENLQALLTSDTFQNQTDWKQDGLFNFCYSLLFRAGYLTLFGAREGSNPSAVYCEFRKFDGLLTKMARTTLKPEEKREAHLVRRHLWDLLSLARPTQGAGPSSWLKSYQQRLREAGVDDETQARALLLQLWATQGNAGPAAFWLLGFLLTNPEAMAAVRREFSSLAAADAARGLLPVKLQDTPVFDSTLSETLRLTAAPFITREVLQGTTLHMADGHVYDLRQGDRLCLFPYLSPQMDPEIHHEPQKFKYDRFLHADGTEKRDFFKSGQKLKYYTMPWGAGKNACVGRLFAISSIRQFLHMVLANLDLELCDPKSVMPAVDASRYGFGMLQPHEDLLIRYKLKPLEA